MLVKIVCVFLGAIMASLAIGLVAVLREDSRMARVMADAWEKSVEERIGLYEDS